MRPRILGLSPQPIPPEIRQTLERNTGVFVWAVNDGSPAFNANILEGDVILKMNGEEVMSPPDYMEKCRRLAGQKIEIEIWRNGRLKTIPVQLNKP